MINDQQLQLIEQQLGRKPRGIAEVSNQTTEGIPVVLRMHSLVDDKPFPTLYWLCSKDLYKAISQIETGGWVKQIEQQLEQDSELRQAYQQNHRDYVALRQGYLSEDEQQRIETLGFSELFQRYGIGGIAQWDKVRCLHMQYAHYLAQPGEGCNVIGQRMEQEFGLSKLQLKL
ncbi:DUF501 domain-containing protein [Motiliproteus sp.]|uniref:DUF501 domain-containing protein n=1 Tax=Motiliproteus sp. TaxID=1898955 RepID=UPI003BA9EC5A